MPVGEGEATSKMVIEPGQVVIPVERRLVRPPGHAWGEVADVDAVGPHVEEYEYLDRSRVSQFGLLEVKFIAGGVQESVPVPPTEAPEEEVHGHAADARLGFAVRSEERRVGKEGRS